MSIQSSLILKALELNVAPQFLSFVGIQDESATIGKILYYFNIEDELHANYKSTVAFKVVC